MTNFTVTGDWTGQGIVTGTATFSPSTGASAPVTALISSGILSTSLPAINGSYLVTFNGVSLNGRPGVISPFVFVSPNSATTVNLNTVVGPSPTVQYGGPANGNPPTAGVSNITPLGWEIITAPDGATILTAIGGLAHSQAIVNVKSFGAVGDGSNDDTTAITNAWSSCGDAHAIYFPAGNYVYNGPGLDAASYGGHGSLLIAKGDGLRTTTITLGSTSYLFNTASQINQLMLEDMWIVGGKGAIKHTYTGVNAGVSQHVNRCYFYNYTECAIATDSADMPYWHIHESIFQAANSTSAIGVALAPGLDDASSITNCGFHQNRVHVKIGSGGNNAHITECAFFNMTTDNSGGPRIDIWVVPSVSSDNAGNGFTIDRNKFSGEEMVAGDYRLVFADDISGGTNGQRLPNLTADSTGYILGNTYTGNMFRCDFTPAPPLIYSTTPNVWTLAFRDIQLWNNYPSYLIQFRTVPPMSALTAFTSGNVFGPVYGIDASQIGPQLSNDPGIGFIDDPMQILQTRSTVPHRYGSGSSVSFSELLSIAVPSFTTFQSTLTGTTDAYGGSDAVTMALTGTVGVALQGISAMNVGVPCWVEIDVAAPTSGTAPTSLTIDIDDQPSSYVHWQRNVEVPASSAGWVTYAFSFVPRAAGTGQRIAITAHGASGNQVRIARPRVYQSHERIIGGRRPAIATQATTPLTHRQLTNDIRNKLIYHGLVAGTPYTDPGTAVTIDLSSTTLTGTTAQFNTALSDNDFATLAGTETLSNKTLASGTKATVFNDPSGNKILNLATGGANSFNSLMIVNNTNGNSVNMYAQAAFDANVDIGIIPVGTGRVFIGSNATYVVTSSSIDTLTNKRITKRVGSVASSATPTINTNNVDQFNITALATPITSMTTNLSGTNTDGQGLRVRVKDNGSAQTLAWGSSFTGNLLSTTVAGKTHTQELVWDAAISKWAGTYVDTAGY